MPIHSLSKIATVLITCGALAACERNIDSSLSLEHGEVTVQGKAHMLPHYGARPFQDEVFYFVLPDRFYNGDPSNDLGASADDEKRALSRGGFDPSHKGMYHGGDLAGLTQQLPYLDGMGVTAIWLTPILRNQAVQAGSSGYHGYWIVDFTEIDPHLGTNEELSQFIDAAHQRNIKVFFDIITNHTADVIRYQECHGNGVVNAQATDCEFTPSTTLQEERYTPFIPHNMENVKIPGWLNDIDAYNNLGDTHWSGESAVKGDFAGLDDLDTTLPGVVTGMIDIYKDLITQFKPDGFRIDTVKHVDIDFWREFSPALMSHARAEGISNFMMFGEVYSFDSAELSQYVINGKLPSVLDFAFQGAIEAVVVNQEGTDKLASLFEQDHLYTHSAGYNANHLVNFTGNHDMGRFAYKLMQSEFNYSESEMLERALLAHALIYFGRGIPVIYYGDEQGFVGDGGDQDSRQDMMQSFVGSYNDDDLLATSSTTADNNFDSSHPFYHAFAEFAEIYQQYPALRRGNQAVLYAQPEPGIFAIERTYTTSNQGTQRMAILFNTREDSQDIPVLGLESSELVYASDSGNGAIQGLSVRIYLVD